MPKFVMKITFFSLLIKFCLLEKTAISVLKNNSNLNRNLTFSLIIKLPISITLSLPQY